MSAYGYDDDDDEEECPLCLDPLGDDIRFKPCNCGYRICAFCWNHIRTNLNGRCPACRKPYSDDAVEFTPMQPDELKRLQAAKKQRDKEKKDADSLSRKHAANVRVRQRSQVHIQGMTTKIANEDTLPALKGSEQFGRFGKIVKLFFSRRASPPPGATGVGGSASGSGSGPSSSVLTPSSSSTASSSNAHTFYTPVNVYINYSRPDEAAACIYAIDGTVTSDGHKLKAIHGTTRYCPAYLRGVKCTNDNCMQAHEPGEELESSSHPGSGAGPSSQPVLLHQQHQHGQPHRYEGAESGRSNATAIKETREELVNLKHAYKEQSAHTAPALTNAPGLPATASWASKQASNPSAQQASSQSPFQNQPSFSSAFPQIQDSRPTPPPTHSQSSSISSRLPKAQNHPLPPRPPSRATSSVDMSAKSRANGREREREREREQDQYRAREPEKQRQRSAANAEDARQTQQQKGDAPAVPREIPKAQEGILPQDQQSLSVDGPARPELSSSSTSTVIAPPTPPTSEPSASTSSLPALSLPPGLGLPSTSTGTRPLTPVSEFDRTLDTFGDGLSFHFNLPSSPTSTSPKGKERSGETVGGVAFDDGFGTSATQSSRTSRSGSPDFLSDTREMMFSPALPASSASAGAGTDLHPFAADDAEDAKYQGPFDPFAMGSDAFGDADPRAEDPTHHALASGRASGTASPATGLGAPPGLSRTNTASPMVDAGMASRPPGLGGVPALPDDGSMSGRHRSRFGFARSASIERPSSGFGAAPGFANGVSIPVSELFKGVTGVGASSSSSSSSAHQIPVIANGRHSPHPPSSATSSASGNLPFSLPPGVFAPSPSSATVQAAFGTAGLPSASAFPASSSELPLPPPDPSRHAKTSLSDLFPGVDLAASFSSSSALPASLVKSLGISLENLDMQATAAANGKLPNFAPMPLGQGNSIASQPLPPPSAPSATSPSPVPSGGAAMTQSLSTGATSSNGGLGGPMGLGAARQAQQAHAQHAQQAHQQAQLAAQQAAAAQAAQNAAAQSAREQQQAQHQAQAQAQQQLQQHHGRPPSAASGGSAGKTDMYGYMGLANATSPPLPQTPGGFGDAARFQDPAIISFAGMNGYAHPPQHNPYAAMHGYHHHHPEHPSPGAPGGGGGVGVGQGEYYNRYHPLPTPVQPQQTYNPYMPIAPVGLAGMGRLNKAAQTMSQAGAFGLLRR